MRCALPPEVVSRVLLFLRIGVIKHRLELVNHDLFQVATKTGMWFQLYVRDFLTSRAKITKKPTRKRRRTDGLSSILKPEESMGIRRGLNDPIPDRPWATLYKLRHAKLLSDASFGAQSDEAQTAILDLELAQTFITSGGIGGNDTGFSNCMELSSLPPVDSSMSDEDLETQFLTGLSPPPSEGFHDCGTCCPSAVPSKDQFGIFVCPYTGRMFEASTVHSVTTTWDNEYTPFAAEEALISEDRGGCVEDVGAGEDWVRPGFWGRCFAAGYDCMTEAECDRMLFGYKEIEPLPSSKIRRTC
eukprot:Protomagalhaensia_wolfi_Nauph_80__5572@NODE_619_length_2201_cov_34_408418_g464_i0_p2_GENE_NODE_619_length_2201_cov_34_408418_g464_i0NODE_619_length_2201_cov_34_408418_g464_i0_p2_ORF_typecomplete_len301_score59_71_NODE_619_length_2201_cov_34_408418_g464_i012562158